MNTTGFPRTAVSPIWSPKDSPFCRLTAMVLRGSDSACTIFGSSSVAVAPRVFWKRLRRDVALNDDEISWNDGAEEDSGSFSAQDIDRHKRKERRKSIVDSAIILHVILRIKGLVIPIGAQTGSEGWKE
jgi:hypothetical protein